MRTNALLLAAAVVAGGSLLAQTTSKNIVGYVNKTVPKDQFVLIANPLNNGGNTVAEVIKISGDITLYHFGATGFTSSLTLGGEWIEGGDVVVAPGGGFFATASGADVKITFVGEVAVGKTVTIPAGLSIRSSALPQAGKLDALEYPVGDETVYQFSNGYIATDALGAWLGDAPTVGVAESFFVLNNGAQKTWTRSFSIN
jgi:hypothetical protein